MARSCEGRPPPRNPGTRSARWATRSKSAPPGDRTGVDARGRRQYRYHDVWRQHRDRDKFDHMLEFAAALPDLRKRCTKFMEGDELTRERVLACATRLLDLGFFRIGTEGYAEQNQT